MNIDRFAGAYRSRWHVCAWIGRLTFNAWITSCGDHKPYIVFNRGFEGQIRIGRNRDLAFELFALSRVSDGDDDTWEAMGEPSANDGWTYFGKDGNELKAHDC